uniref:HDC19233 n=1 Tax=Drosophila melanogaster TaxID=7227 RepID=Q6IIA2_DROME|nr:TPA_inf: HDC19233 [Drosophila melanogaster]
MGQGALQKTTQHPTSPPTTTHHPILNPLADFNRVLGAHFNARRFQLTVATATQHERQMHCKRAVGEFWGLDGWICVDSVGSGWLEWVGLHPNHLQPRKSSANVAPPARLAPPTGKCKGNAQLNNVRTGVHYTFAAFALAFMGVACPPLHGHTLILILILSPSPCPFAYPFGSASSSLSSSMLMPHPHPMDGESASGKCLP